MATSAENPALSGPFAALADYERRSLAHVAGAPEQIDAQGLWRGIGFRVGARRFVSGIDEIGELLLMPVLTVVPGTRPWMLGVANVRGNLMPVVDLAQFLYGTRTQVSERSRVLLVRHGSSATGLLVDEVLGQRNLTDEQRQQGSVPEDDEHLQRFVAENVRLGEQSWGVFNMSSLIKASDFQQAAV